MSVKVMARVWAHSKCSGTALVTVLALADWADDEGWSWPSLPKLAQKARLGTRQLCKVLSDIEQHTGEIRRERSSGGRNKRTRYRVTIPENSVLENTVTENTVSQRQETVSCRTGALIRHRSVNKRESTESDKPIPDSLSTKEKRKRTRPAPDNRVEPFLTWFAEEYQKRHDAPYAVNWGKDGRLIKGLPPAFDLLRLKDLAVRFFESQDPWIRQNGGFTVGVFISQINKLTSTGSNGNGHPKPAQVKHLGNGMVQVDDRLMDEHTYERRHGQHAN